MQNILSTVSGILQTTPARWTFLTGSLPVELLIDTEQVFSTRLLAFLAGRDFAAFNPDEQGTKADADPQPAELAARFTRLRQANLAGVDQLTPADLGRKARHAELGLVTLQQMLNEWAAHDLNHTIQAERALIQPFIQDCGPWQVYFQDQVIK
jgi:hypothetical protein